MEILQAVTEGRGNFKIARLEVNDPAPGEVLVDLKAAGICHTDYDSMSWSRTLVMGHEGAGVVEAVGEGVTEVNAGDHVILNWAMLCKICFQ